MSNTTQYLTVNKKSSRIPVKSVSTSFIDQPPVLPPVPPLPRPTGSSTSSTISSRSRLTHVPKTQQRATTVPKVQRRRGSSASSNSSSSTGWLTSIFSSSSTSTSSLKKKKIKSIVRLFFEDDKKSREWQVDDHAIKYLGSKSSKKYEFDHVFNSRISNQKIYDSSIKSVVEQFMKGLNGTIFTYGQPGTGKTYIEPLKISEENKRRGPFVSSLREQVLYSPNDIYQLIDKAEANRYMSTNNYELYCSRAHTFIQITIERREKQQTGKVNSNGSTNVTSSTSTSSLRKTRVPKSSKKRDAVQISYLYLADLASNDKSTYQSLKNPINKSCLALEAVVHNLSETGKSIGHPSPPYHDSKLTRLLQPSFTGQHHVVSICTVDMKAAIEDEMPTLDTFNFAARIRRIPISPKVNEISEDKSLLVKYVNDISLLNSKLERLEKEQHEAHKDLSRIKSILERRRHYLSNAILSARSIVYTHNPFNEIEDDHWKMISRLRGEYEEDNHLNAVMEESHRSLHDSEKIAKLEAELNMTRAELQVAQLLVDESTSTPSIMFKQK
ncbi:Kinesin-related protein 11 [Choanephora cucurbitarum]|uniref:Kinesin-related protein 11 n=1 Tax=Choanephora cucurbitarum TaxID=101091 RepID=A0A1C7N2L9_9FUNG|nr:Kinesin-related protein 11 [Choanephora cucurbitarum]